MAYWSLNLLKSKARGVRKVTKGIISLWSPNIHNNFFFHIVDDVILIRVLIACFIDVCH